jgi:hypothetical protein
MQTLIIVFELTSPASHQERIIQKIHTFPRWARLAPNAYLIKTDHSPVQARDEFEKLLSKSDKIFIGSCPIPSAWYGQPEDVSKWILENQPKT